MKLISAFLLTFSAGQAMGLTKDINPIAAPKIVISNEDVPLYRNSYMGIYELDGIKIYYKPFLINKDVNIGSMVKRGLFEGYGEISLLLPPPGTVSTPIYMPFPCTHLVVRYYTFPSEGEEDNSILRETLFEENKASLKEICIKSSLSNTQQRPVFNLAFTPLSLKVRTGLYILSSKDLFVESKQKLPEDLSWVHQ